MSSRTRVHESDHEQTHIVHQTASETDEVREAAEKVLFLMARQLRGGRH